MKYLKLFESFEVVEPIKYGEPLNNKEINFLKGYNIMCPEWILKDDNYYYVHDHRCENIKDLPLTYIHGVCSKYEIKKYTINDDYTIDVDGNVDLDVKSLIKIPLIFNRVSGSFNCSHNKLTTLEGSPKYAYSFYCSHNKLTTLEGSPKYAYSFYCYYNQLTTLEGCPKRVGGGFFCYNNQLTTLKGGPESVGWQFDCDMNKLTTLEGGPEYVGGDFSCVDNPLVSTKHEGKIRGKILYKL